MKIRTIRNVDPEEVNLLVVYIGEDWYRITESIDGKLNINKSSDGDNELISIHPRMANEIEIS